MLGDFGVFGAAEKGVREDLSGHTEGVAFLRFAVPQVSKESLVI